MLQKRITYIFLGILALVLVALLAEMLTDTAALDEQYLARLNNERVAKDAFLQGNAESPLPTVMRDTFTRLPYYAPTATFILQARYAATKPDSVGGLLRAGTLTFTYANREHRLTAFWETAKRDNLFIPFRDATSGTETYGGGRYLAIPATPAMLSGQSFQLDFNFAYHPYCVYNLEYVCPVPPPENKLDFAVRAGERLAQGAKP